MPVEFIYLIGAFIGFILGFIVGRNWKNEVGKRQSIEDHQTKGEYLSLKAKLSHLTATIKDDERAERGGMNCHDQHHDDRWCPTCEARKDGIDDYRDMLLSEVEK